MLLGTAVQPVQAWKTDFKPMMMMMMNQYSHVSQLYILTSPAKPGFPGAVKSGCVCTADYQKLLGTAVHPVLACKNGR